MVSIKKHYTEIDVYKGIAILLIILGHSFCTFPVDFRETSLTSVQHLIGTFNLNMFFLASGVLFSVKGAWRDFFQKKVSRLIVPWFSFVVVALVVKKVMAAYVNHPAGSFGHELFMDVVYGKSYWFLYVLFLMMIVTKLLKDRCVMMIVGGVLLFLLPLSQHIPVAYNFLCAERFIHYYPWFLMGFLIKDKYDIISKASKRAKRFLLIGGLLLLTAMVVMMLTGISKVCIVKNYIMPVLGCASCYLLACAICYKRGLERVFSFFGKYSLQYYLNHLLIMLACYYLGAQLFAFSPLASLMVIYIMALLISSLMLWIERNTPKPIRNLFGFL